MLLIFGQCCLVLMLWFGSAAQQFDLALQASKDGRFDQALELWDGVIKNSPNDGAAWSNRGNVRLALGDPEGAIADQTESLKLAPDIGDAHLNRGTAEEFLGRWQAASSDYEWILERDPANAAANYNLGNVEGSLDDWISARQSFLLAAEVKPGMAMARSSSPCCISAGKLKPSGIGIAQFDSPLSLIC